MPFRASVVTAALLASAAGVLHGAEFERPRTFAIEGARVVRVGAPTLESGTVVIRGGLIEAVGAGVPVPDDAWRIDGKGLTVLPGFFDAMTTLGTPGEKGESNKGPLSRGPQDRPATYTWKLAADDLQLKADDRSSWRIGGFTTPVFAPQGGIFSGQASVIALGEGDARAQVVEPRVALITRLPSQSIGYDGYPNSLLGRIAYIRQVFLDARHYETVWGMYREDPSGLERPRFDHTLEPVVETLAAGRPILYPADSERELRRVLRLAAELELELAAYGGRAAYVPGLADAFADAGLPVLVDVSWPKPPDDPDPDAEPSLETLRFRDRAPSAPSALAAAGVSFAFYASEAKKPEDFLAGVRRAVMAGLEPAAAARALTLGAAEIYGVADRLGSIEPGKIANLVIFEGDWLADKAKPKMVFLDGRLDEAE